jgi:hypothetical protein
MYATTIIMYHIDLHNRILEVSKSDMCLMDISVTLQHVTPQDRAPIVNVNVNMFCRLVSQVNIS